MKYHLMKCKKYQIVEQRFCITDVYKWAKNSIVTLLQNQHLQIKDGTKICEKIENSAVKSIVKSEQLVIIQMQKETEIEETEIYSIYNSLLQNNVIVEAFEKEEDKIQFRIKKAEQNKVQELLDSKYPNYKLKQKDLIKVSIVGYGITQDNIILNKVMEILQKDKIQVMNVNLTQSKIEIIVKQIENKTIEELHTKLIK